MGDSKEKIGLLIRAARKQKGLTQKELGEKLGLAESTVTNYEAGKQNLTLDTLDKIAEALQVKLNISLK
ncbi:helix-turn-helix domain-containing protein [Spirosoma agri]|uniref:Helix-turn-helix transcriptional regulator n=1 Tax=Spirosoma agri TaxID=1987381 RepID=A0A6M0IHN7_9BACT|nr:helix-turn-helix transcriptional regulator [Spirosoma agri]NEU67790.1 helix-turn-helix transcriptional regulator [Spirosoma agri]